MRTIICDLTRDQLAARDCTGCFGCWVRTPGRCVLPDSLCDLPSLVARTDELWLFSASEVCGAITWFTDEYGDEPNLYTGYVDFAPYDEMLSSEGEQYEYFASSGVRASSDPLGVLKLAYGSSATSWWYRTSYPYTFTGEDASYFYQVMASGYPSMTSRR